MKTSCVPARNDLVGVTGFGDPDSPGFDVDLVGCAGQTALTSPSLTGTRAWGIVRLDETRAIECFDNRETLQTRNDAPLRRSPMKQVQRVCRAMQRGLPHPALTCGRSA